MSEEEEEEERRCVCREGKGDEFPDILGKSGEEDSPPFPPPII